MTLKIDKDKIKSILIIQPSRIGDVVFSLPVLAGLRKLFPDAYIAWLVDDRCKELVEGNPYLDEVIVFPFKQLKKHLGKVREVGHPPKGSSTVREVYKLKKLLKEKNFDLSIDLHGLAKSAFIVWLAKAKYRIGSASSYGMKELSYLFSKEISPENENMHCVDRHLAVLRYLGGEVEKDFTIKVSDQDRFYVDTLLENLGIDSNDNLVIVQTGGGWKSRRWFPERFSVLADSLIETYKCKVLFIGGKPGGSPESGIIDRVMSFMEKKAHNISGLLTLKQLVVLLGKGKVKLFVGNEAGPMHLACALNVPVVAIIGPTDPSRTGPFSKNSIVVRKPVSCAPCKERNCKKLDCMKSISVEDVMSAVGKLL